MISAGMNEHEDLNGDASAPRSPASRAPSREAGTSPNVLVILIDDMGFGAPSVYGGPCAMPTAERLAANGLQYSRFHVASLCSPTRQSLLTGRNNHAVGMGATVDQATSSPGYTSIRPPSAATLAQVLRFNGYRTSAFGKWHQTPLWETGPSGPHDRWPTGEGFEKFYGFLACEIDHWNPLLYDGTTPVDEARGEGYHLSEDLADQAIEWLHLQQTVSPEEPFFMYLPFGACHAPLHVPRSWRDRYVGRFSLGWDQQRERTFERQKELGLIPRDAELPPWPDDIPHWDSLSEEQRKVAEAFMETYAAFAEHTDAQVGRIVDALRESGLLDSTIIFYILGDNGGSGEGGIDGTLNTERAYSGIYEAAESMVEHVDEIGGPDHLPLHPVGWSLALNTPYRWTKSVASHFGGTRNGMIVHWPAGIDSRGEIRHQWHHVNDIFPTILDVAGIEPPAEFNGIAQQRLDGTSIAYSFDDGSAAERHTTQYFESVGNRSIYHDGWIAAAKHRAPWEAPRAGMDFEYDPWELYDLTADWTQAHDLADRYPDKLTELKELFEQEAVRNQVFPLDHRLEARANPSIAGRPDGARGRTVMTLRAGMTRFPEECVLNLKNRSHSIQAQVEILSERCDGVIVHQGGKFAGWTLYCEAGLPTYVYNYYGLEQTIIQSDVPLALGKQMITCVFDYDGGLGGAATIELRVDGERVAIGRIPRTVAYFFSYHEGLDIGVDLGTPVAAYPWKDTRFSSRIESVRLAVQDSDVIEGEASGRIRGLLSSQ